MKEHVRHSPLAALSLVVAAVSLAVLTLVLARGGSRVANKLDRACPACKARSRAIHDLNVVYEWPTRAESNHVDQIAADKLRGLLVILPDCNVSAGSFWLRGPFCSTCSAEVKSSVIPLRIVAQALSRDYVPVVLSKAMDGKEASAECWDVSTNGDRARVARAFSTWRDLNSVSRNLRTIVLGMGDAGVALASELPFVMRVDGVATIGSALSPRVRNHGKVKNREAYPPVAHVVEKELVATGLPARAPMMEVVTTDYFMIGLANLVRAEAEQVSLALRDGGLVDAEGFLLRSPAGSSVGEFLSAQNVTTFSSYTIAQIDRQLEATWGEHKRIDNSLSSALQYFEVSP
mmetsp:Transcript_53242/g.130470  ORF Transcript_53242/g.130470 Transcript_53242/m.130470 type:complete len:347 (+) Transcript_53242:65-1105(+)